MEQNPDWYCWKHVLTQLFWPQMAAVEQVDHQVPLDPTLEQLTSNLLIVFSWLVLILMTA